MPEPIATAFVDIRPSAESFQSEAESEVRAAIGERPVEIASQVKLQGVAQARNELRQLSRSVSEAGGQLQIEGLQTAATEVQGLTADLQAASTVDFADTLDPIAAGVKTARSEIDDLARSVASVPVGIGSGLSGELNESAAAASNLSAEAASMSGTLSDAATTASALIAANERAAASETRLATATRASTRATIEADVAERDFVRLRSRRAAAVGPLRLAGVGVGAGVAIFTATQALGELSGALEVTGNEAATTTGQLRNFGASLLSGNVVGAFKALTNESQSYSLAQLIAIQRSEEFTAALEKMGRGADLAKSKLAALQGLSEIPQFLQTAEKRIQVTGGGDEAQLKNLQQQEAAIKRQLKIAASLNADQTALNILREALFSKQLDIDEKQAAINQQRQTRRQARLQERVIDAQLKGDVDAEITALKAEAREYQRLIDATDTAASDRQAAKANLQTANQRIESLQDQIVAEEQRHNQAMFAKRLIPAQLDQLRAQLAGDVNAQIAALRAEIAAINVFIAEKKLRGNALANKLAQIVSLNAQIESLQQGIVAEEQRHASEMQQAQDDAHQAILDGLSGREAEIQNKLAAAALDASLANDIKFQRQLLTFYRRAIENDNLTAEERRRYIGLRISAQAELRSLLAQEKAATAAAVQDALSAREDKLQDQLAIARANERSTADDARALRNLIAFYRKQAKNRDLSVAARRDFLVKQKQTERDLRDLKSTTERQGASFKELAFSFLQEQQGFASNLAGNLLAPGGGDFGSFLGGRPSTSTTAPKKPPVPGAKPTTRDITSPFERAAAAGDPAAGALAFRGAGGTTPTGGQLDALIHINRQMLRTLTDIRTGIGHPEARQVRKATHHRVEVGVE